jgi:hypothetical protein
MSTAAAPALETGGGSTTSGSAAVAADPVDALDLGNLDSDTAIPDDIAIPDSMVLGGKPEPINDEDDAPGQATGQARDEAGKFAAKDAKQDPKKDAPDEAPADQPAPVLTPFKYRAMGETHDLTGATVNEQGDVTIPAAKAGELREAYNALHLTKGHFAPVLEQKERTITELKQRMTEMESTRSANDAKAEQLVGLLSSVMSEPDDEKAIQALWALRTNWGTLVSKAEAEHYKSEIERLKKAPARTETPRETEREAPPRTGSMAEAARAVTRDYVEELKVRHEFRDISGDLWKQIDAEIERTPMAFLRPATAKDAELYGVQVGQDVFDRDLVIERITAKRTEATKARETAADAARLAADNARRTQPSVQAPPSPSGGRAAPTKRGKGFTNQQDVADWWDSDEL